MIHRIKRLSMGLVGLAACGAITSGCGVSSGGSGGGAGANATGGIPATASSAKLRDHELRGLQGKTIAWVPVGLGTPLTEEWTRQLKQGAQAAGMKFVLRDPNWDVQKQADAVRSLINEHPDVLIVHNFDVNLLAKLIQQAQAKGIYVLQVNMVSNYKSDAFVGADTIGLGERIAGDIVKTCGSGTSGKVQIVQGDATSGFTLGLMEGAKKVFSRHPEIKVVSTQAANWDRSKAHDITANVIQQHPDLCASWGFWDQMEYGAAQAIKQAGKIGQVKVFTSDHSDIACKAVRDGLFYESVAYSVPQQGEDLVALAKYLLQSGLKPGTARTALFSRLYTINKSNYNQPGMCYDGKHDGLTVR